MARTQVAISTDAVGDLYSITVWDISTGNVLTSYKAANGLAVAPRCIDLVSDHYLLCTYSRSPLLNVWSLAKRDHLHCKMILPGVASALAISACGNFCFVAIECKIYIWQLSSGALLNVLEKHYQAITVIRVSRDGARFITAAEDGLIHVWSFARAVIQSGTFVVTGGGASNRFDPIRSIVASKVGKINDIYMAPSGVHFVAATEDGCCAFYRMYDDDGSAPVAKLLFDCPVRSVVMDRSERFVFAGLANGEIRRSALADWATSLPGATDSGGDHGRLIDLSEQSTDMKNRKPIDLNQTRNPNETLSPSSSTFIGHTDSVTTLAVTIDGHGLLSGSTDRTIKLWHIDSRQCMRTTTFRGTITNLLVSSALSGLFAYESLQSQQSLQLMCREPNSMFAGTDISLRSSTPTNEATNRRRSSSGGGSKKSTASHHQSSSYLFDMAAHAARPLTYDALMRKAANPPPPIQSFRREIYRPADRNSYARRDGGGGDSKIDAFASGSIWIANDTRSGAQFWPWQDWHTPTDDEVNKIFRSKKSNLASLGLERIPRTAGASKKNKRHKSSLSSSSPSSVLRISNNGDNTNQTIDIDDDDDDNQVVHIDDDDDDDGDEGEEEEDKDATIRELREQNAKLFQYSLDKIFSNLENFNSDSSSAFFSQASRSTSASTSLISHSK